MRSTVGGVQLADGLDGGRRPVSSWPSVRRNCNGRRLLLCPRLELRVGRKGRLEERTAAVVSPVSGSEREIERRSGGGEEERGSIDWGEM